MNQVRNLLLLFSLIISTQLHAAIFWVSNVAGSAAPYSTINSAIAAANPFDTIYVSGSPSLYPACTVDKSLTLIGPGTYRQSDMHFPAQCDPITIAAGVDSVKIAGFKFTGNSSWLILLNGVSFVNISNNNFNFIAPSYGIFSLNNNNNVIIENNSFSIENYNMISASNSNFNFIFRNNIVHTGGQLFFNFNVPNAVFEHNTFIGDSPSTSIFTNATGIAIQNNIFYNIDPTLGISASAFNNNITYNSTGTILPLLGGSNLDNINPELTNLSNLNSFSIINNYHVSNSGPAHNSASDGTDIGYYGGTSNINQHPFGEPYNMPVIRKMDVQNVSVPQNGNVNVKVRSTISRSE